MSENPILIIDGMNLFIRSWAAYPTMSGHGYQMGGTIGFLKSLKRICNIVNPKSVYVAWEGGGSTKRKGIYSDYKLTRKPEKLNRFYKDDLPESDENRKHQLLTLLELLKYVPVYHLYTDDCEGDDVIAYITKGPFKNESKVIVSSDKDMYQLLDQPLTQIYSLHKKTFVTSQTVLEEYKILSSNFALAKALCGDNSDNIPGVKGLGFKTLVKKLPIIGLQENLLLDTIFDYCEGNIKESIHYKRILDAKDIIKRNWRLIYLDQHTLNFKQIQKINETISSPPPTADRMSFMKILSKESLNDFDVPDFYNVVKFNRK